MALPRSARATDTKHQMQAVNRQAVRIILLIIGYRLHAVAALVCVALRTGQACAVGPVM